MKRTLVTAAGLLIAGALTLNAQTPQTPTPQQQPQPRPTDPQTRPTDPQTKPGDTTQRAGQQGDQTLTIVGCIKEEKDIPGRKPNAAERAGVTEDYILTNVKMGQGSATSGIGLAQMYDIEGISEAELKKHLNHQVELTGTLPRGSQQGQRGAPSAGAPAGGGTPGGTTNADLPEFRATSLKMVSATCPAAP